MSSLNLCAIGQTEVLVQLRASAKMRGRWRGAK
jgi:hypothetical protein